MTTAWKNNSCKILWVHLLIATIAVPSSAQTGPTLPSGIELGLGSGYTLPHRDMMQHLVTGHSKQIAIGCGWNLSGGWTDRRDATGHYWHGVELAWTELGGDALGTMTSALWLTRFPSKIGHTELGLGAGWSSTPWHAESAPSSVAISTRLNAGLHAAWVFPILRTPRSAWLVKARFTHFSNGAISLPNLGINNIGLDLRHQWRDEHDIPQRRLTSYREERRGALALEMSLRAGVRDVGLPGGELHPIFNVHVLGLHHSKRSPSRAWVVANDLGYNQSLRVTGAASGANSPLNRLQYSILGGARWDFNRIQVTALQGWMCTNPDQELGAMYLMVTMHYECSPAVAIELGLKSFQFRADYPFIGFRHQLGSLKKGRLENVD